MPLSLDPTQLDPELLAYLSKNSGLQLDPSKVIPGDGPPSINPIAGADRGLTPAGVNAGIAKGSLGDLSDIGKGSSKASLLSPLSGLQPEQAQQVAPPTLYDTNQRFSNIGVWRPFVNDQGVPDNLFGRHEYMPDPREAAANQAAMAANAQMQDAYMRSQTAANEGAANRNAQAAQQTQLLNAQQGFHQADNQSRLDVEKLRQQGDVESAKIRAGMEHESAMNKATMDATAAMAMGKMSPQEFDAFSKSIQASRRPAGGQGGSAPAAGAPGQDPAVQAAQQLSQQKQALNTVTGTLMDPTTGKPLASVGNPQMDALLERAAALDNPQRAALIKELQTGRYGDPAAILKALATRTAGSYLVAQPPTKPGTQDPIDFRTAMIKDIPAQYDVPGAAGGRPLVSLQSTGRSPLGIASSWVGGAGFVPYQQMTLGNGQVIPVNPTDLYNMHQNNPIAGKGATPQQWQNRAGLGGQLLQMWLNPQNQ